MRYPKGAVDDAIAALELSRSYLRDDVPVAVEKIDEALHALYRLREIGEGIPHPYRSARAAQSAALPEESDPAPETREETEA